ncbi:MAG: anti-sigma factor family protein [Chloroflexota bacterium]
MKCQQVYRLMQAYLDVEVTPDEERQVEAHIRACPRCRRRLVHLAQAANQLADGTRASVSKDFTHRLISRLEAGELGAVDDIPELAKSRPRPTDTKLR